MIRRPCSLVLCQIQARHQELVHMLRIATWNLEGPKLTAKRLARLKKRMACVAADIWIQTESHLEAAPADGWKHQSTTPLETMTDDGQRKVIIWSKVPILSTLSHGVENSLVAVEVEIGEKPIIVVGVVLPYHAAGMKSEYQWCGETYSGIDHAWKLHTKAISATGDLLTLVRQQFPHHFICLGGDFNQARCHPPRPRVYGNAAVRLELTRMLDANELECVTDHDFVAEKKLDKSLVDHICLSKSLTERINSVDVWQRDDSTTDHNGVYVDLDL